LRLTEETGSGLYRACSSPASSPVARSSFLKRTLFQFAVTFAFTAAIAAFGRPAAAAEIKVLEPADHSLITGTVKFRLQPVHAVTDMFLQNPEISILDEYGTEIDKFRAARDVKTQICSATFDTTKVKDGTYTVTIVYPTLLKGQTRQETREDLTLGVRNTKRVPARFTVDTATSETKAGESSEITIKVLDKYGRLMPGARITFKVDKGEVDKDAELTDSEGEAIAAVDSEDAQTVTLTVTVENLPPVTKVIKFVP
jgi:hypothetical protein